jgi:hypothetical protein
MSIIEGGFGHHFSPAHTPPPVKICGGKMLAGKTTSIVNRKTNQEILRQ